ncbi:terpene synthase family protein [Burkholderia pseudomallei]|uniref:terpene synthase family protein n=1 Tax=Burkholderia pseudomallei TaxID=28450 RepID=UPI0021560926|nr:terpene synthase family protein [Burkholderia pseudomallei]
MDAARSNAASPHARRRRPPCPPRPRPRRCRRLVGSSAKRAALPRSNVRLSAVSIRTGVRCTRIASDGSASSRSRPPDHRRPTCARSAIRTSSPAITSARRRPCSKRSPVCRSGSSSGTTGTTRTRGGCAAPRGRACATRCARCAVLASPRARVADAEPIVGALSDCIVRIRARLGDAWNRRFTGHLRQMIDAYDDEFRARLAARIPTRDAYMRLRERTFDCEARLDCLELAAGRALPDAVRAAPPYRLAGPARRSNSPRFTTISVRCARSAKPKKSTISAFR